MTTRCVQHILLLAAAVSLLLLIPFHCMAADGVVLTEEIQLKVADAFMEDHEYYRAVTEYKRFIILFPHSQRADYALYAMAMAFYRGEDYGSSLKTFSRLQSAYPESPYLPAVLYIRGLVQWRMKDRDGALLSFRNVQENHRESEYGPLALLAEALMTMDGEDVEGSLAVLKRFALAYPDDPRRDQVTEAILLLGGYADLPRKSEVLAAIMSVFLPGSGYVYAGHPGDGATSFFLNGLFIAGTWAALGNATYALAGITGVIGVPFYLGNIYGSANAAAKWNRAIRNDLKTKVSRTIGFDTTSPPVP